MALIGRVDDSARGPRSPIIAVELLLFGLWGLTAPYLGRVLGLDVDTAATAEIADHVVPGLAVLVVAATALSSGRRTRGGSLLVGACGVWMTATHVPLLRQAIDGQASLAASLWHAIPGMVILMLGAIAIVIDSRQGSGVNDVTMPAREQPADLDQVAPREDRAPGPSA
ncbi:MAG: hypothetical protein NVSMB29_02380 [Candidatus Dormibacteria bacterium]